MFPAPPEITARHFSTLPAAFQQFGKPSDWLFGKRDQSIGSFLEGPIVDEDGNLIVADIPFGRIFRVDAAGAFELLIEYDGEPNGLALSPDGMIWISDHRNGLMQFDRQQGEVRPVTRRLRREGFKGLNDVLQAPDGTLYLTDQGQTGMQDPTGRVFARRGDGRIDMLLDTLPSPNGMALSPDRKTLYVSVTRANQVWRLPLHEDGSTTKVNVFLHLMGGHTGPDGLVADGDGNLYVCHCGLGCVWVFNEMGVPISRINIPAGLDVTSACLGGADGRDLYVIESSTGTISHCHLSDVPGVGK